MSMENKSNIACNFETTAYLAQMLARENITVTHSASIPSAAFDLDSRTLILPSWDASKVGENGKEVFHFLVGHEVAHALHTPADKWKAEADRIGGAQGARVAQDFINVIEDARIEKMIKREFPGLRRDFAIGYETFGKMDLFKIEGRPLETLSFIDRINLHFKMGLHTGLKVPFLTAEEEQIVREVESVITFDDVTKIAERVYNMEARRKQQQQQEQAQGAAGQGDEQDGEEEGQDISIGANGSDGDSDEQESQGGTKFENQDAEDGDLSGADGKGNGEDGEDAEAEGDSTGEGAEGEEASPSSGGAGVVPDVPSTAKAVEKFSQSLVNAKYTEEALRVHQIDPSKIVVTPEEFIDLCNNTIMEYGKHYAKNTNGDTALKVQEDSIRLFEDMSRKQKATVDAMVKRFETRRAARDAARTGSCKSGRISMRSLSKYKYSEDIFDRVIIKRDEKNHGIVILLDWSGSMSGIVNSVVNQIGGILLFCRRVGIPAELYFFTSAYSKIANEYFESQKATNTKIGRDASRMDMVRFGGSQSYPLSDESFHFTDVACNLPLGTAKKGNCAIYTAFSLVKVYDARMDLRKFQNSFGRLLLLANMHGGRCGPSQGVAKHALYTGDELALGNTPLDESMIAMRPILEKFGKSSNTKVTFISMTDGDGNGIDLFYNRTIRGEQDGNNLLTRVLIDARTGRRYINPDKRERTSFVGSTHHQVVSMLRDTTNCSFVSINLVPQGSSLRSTTQYGRYLHSENNIFHQNGYALTDHGVQVVQKDEEFVKANRYIAIKQKPYDLCFIMHVGVDYVNDRKEAQERKRLETMKNRKVALTREIILNSKREDCNRDFINRLMDIVA
jgi:hypothetical protein